MTRLQPATGCLRLNAATGNYEHDEAACGGGAGDPRSDPQWQLPGPPLAIESEVILPRDHGDRGARGLSWCEVRLEKARSNLELVSALGQPALRGPGSPVQRELYAGMLEHWRMVVADNGHMFSGQSSFRNDRTDREISWSYCVRCGTVRSVD